MAILTDRGHAVKLYIFTTGAIFALLTAVHIWRATIETHLARDPWYAAITLIAAAFALWAWRLLRSARRVG